MRTLEPPPHALFGPDGTPRFGAYRGSLPRVDLSPLGRGALFRVARHKRWIYVAVATPEIFAAVAIVRLGYVASSFAFVAERGAHSLLVDRSAMGPPPAGHVGEAPGEGCVAGFSFGGYRARVTRPIASPAYHVEVEAKDLEIRVALDATDAPPPIAVVAQVPRGVVNTTEKRALLATRGEAALAGRRFSLDGGLGGYDYTNGYLARHTAWKWAFALGRAKSGERVGLNLVEGFVGEPECAAWIDDELVPLAEGRFEHDRGDPSAPWRVRTADDRVDLRFAPSGVHAEHMNLGLVASRFVQPAGAFTGTIALPGRAPLELDAVLGVTEDQDVLW